MHNLEDGWVDFEDGFTFDLTRVERECIDVLLVTFEFAVFHNEVSDVLAVQFGVNLRVFIQRELRLILPLDRT